MTNIFKCTIKTDYASAIEEEDVLQITLHYASAIEEEDVLEITLHYASAIEEEDVMHFFAIRAAEPPNRGLTLFKTKLPLRFC